MPDLEAVRAEFEAAEERGRAETGATASGFVGSSSTQRSAMRQAE